MLIDRSQNTYQQYRERARDLYERSSVQHGDAFGARDVLESVSVPLHAHVAVCEDGAFVAAVVWVPAAKLQRPESAQDVGESAQDVGESDV